MDVFGVWALITYAFLIAPLGDERFSVRRDAHEHLKERMQSLGGVSILPYIRSASAHPDLEIARRSQSILSCFYDVRPSAYPAIPYIDMLPANYPDRQGVIDFTLSRSRIGVTYWTADSDWPEWRAATRLLIKDLVDRGCPRSCIVAWLDIMVEEEKQYRKNRNLPSLVPVEPERIPAPKQGAN